jgi:hypothetical protein
MRWSSSIISLLEPRAQNFFLSRAVSQRYDQALLSRYRRESFPYYLHRRQCSREVAIDIRPRSDANKINPNSIKNINVAIFSANGFDATTVDPNTVRFGATGTEAAPIHVALRDINEDGLFDMVVRFQIQDTGIKCGNISAVLTGQISNGPTIIASSPITTVQCGN